MSFPSFSLPISLHFDRQFLVMSAAPPPPPAHDPPVPIAAPTTAADPTTATALPAFLAIPTVKNLLNNPRLNKVFFHLFHHGYVTNSVDKILENFVDVLVDRKEHLRQAGVPTWDDFAKELPFHFPSECCTFVYGDNLYLFGPRGVYTILPSGDILHTVEIGFMEVPLGTESQVEMKGNFQKFSFFFFFLKKAFDPFRFLFFIYFYFLSLFQSTSCREGNSHHR